MGLQYAQASADETCENATLPTGLVAEDCVETVEPELSELCALYIGLPTDADPTTWGTVDLSTISGIEAAKTAGTIVYLPIVGSKATPERAEIPMPRAQVKRVGGTYTITARFMDLKIANYEALLKWQHGATIRFAYEDLGGFIYGAKSPDKGIYAKIIGVEFPHEEGVDSILNAIITIQWKAKLDPKKIVSPYSEAYVAP